MIKGSGIMENISITLPKTLVVKIDTIRGSIPRSTFLKDIVEQYFSKK